jgi:hypothetical protein
MTLQFPFQFTLSDDRTNITALSIQLPNSWTCDNTDFSSNIGNVDLQGSWAVTDDSFNIDHDNQIGTNHEGDPIYITIQGTFDSSGSSASGSWSLGSGSAIGTCSGAWTGTNTGS